MVETAEDCTVRPADRETLLWIKMAAEWKKTSWQWTDLSQGIMSLYTKCDNKKILKKTHDMIRVILLFLQDKVCQQSPGWSKWNADYVQSVQGPHRGTMGRGKRGKCKCIWSERPLMANHMCTFGPIKALHCVYDHWPYDVAYFQCCQITVQVAIIFYI